MRPNYTDGPISKSVVACNIGGMSNRPLSLLYLKKRWALPWVSLSPGSANHPPPVGHSSFFFASYGGKVVMICEFAQHWELAPTQGPKGGTPDLGGSSSVLHGRIYFNLLFSFWLLSSLGLPKSFT